MAREFTIEGYRELIDTLRARRYAVVDFHSMDPAKAHLIIRHDIDMSLAAALAIARVEADMGVRATFFVLVRCEFYNVHAPESARMIHDIADLGHEIGLHFDAALYPDRLEALDDAARAECEVLAQASGTAVRTISFHRPNSALLGLDRPLAGRLHAYQPRFFRDIAYCSDSQGRWRHGHPLDHPAVAAGRTLQLLTHPVWWTARAGETPEARLRRFLAERADYLDRELAVHCKTHIAKAKSKE